MNTWDLKTLDLKPRLPEILSSSDSARAIALDLAAGETLSEHEVHERAWILVIDGAIEVTTATGERTSGNGGLLFRHFSQTSANPPPRRQAGVVAPRCR